MHKLTVVQVEDHEGIGLVLVAWRWKLLSVGMKTGLMHDLDRKSKEVSE